MLGMSANEGAELIVGQPEAPVVRIPTEQESPLLAMVWVQGGQHSRDRRRLVCQVQTVQTQVGDLKTEILPLYRLPSRQTAVVPNVSVANFKQIDWNFGLRGG